jgi:hypothetical protein
MKSEYVIKHANGTYYRGMTGIGPRFGGTVEEAERFASKGDAQWVIAQDWRIDGVVEQAPEPTEDE